MRRSVRVGHRRSKMRRSRLHIYVCLCPSSDLIWGQMMWYILIARLLLVSQIDSLKEMKSQPAQPWTINKILYVWCNSEMLKFFLHARWLWQRWQEEPQQACLRGWKLSFPTYKCYILLTGCVQQADSVVFSLLDTAVREWAARNETIQFPKWWR